jgi:hypothetical protein
LRRGLSILLLGKITDKISNLGRLKAGVSSDFWGNCMISKKNSVGKRHFIGLSYIR